MFSEIAEKDNKPNVAWLFKAITYAEQVHATNHARNMGLLKATAKNLQYTMKPKFDDNENRKKA